MERSYLNAWKKFQKHATQIINKHINNLVDSNTSSSGYLKALKALSVCKQEARQARDSITKKLAQSLNTANIGT